MATIVLTGGVLLAIALLAVWMLWKRAHEVRALAERGRPVSGRVVDRRARHSRATAGRHRRVKLAYERPDTGPQARWIVVTSSEWETLVEGAPVDLVYLPERPSVFGMRSLVNQARDAMGLPPAPGATN
jgi:hypothetical protein